MTTRFLIGDVFDRLAEIPAESVDFALCSPPFLALRRYLPDGHPDKAREIGSEATPADYLDALLRWTAVVGRTLTPWGSLAVELGDTYAGSGGAGGDYAVDGQRAGQQAFAGSAKVRRRLVGDYPVRDDNPRPGRSGRTKFKRVETGNAHPIRCMNDKVQPGVPGWPLDKSLCGIPFAYMLSLTYGVNVLRLPMTAADALRWVDDLRASGLTADAALALVGGWVAEHGDPTSPAGMWRVRTVKPWIRSNPPVGALGDKERPATSYVIVATRARDRWFDLDAVRTTAGPPGGSATPGPRKDTGSRQDDGVAHLSNNHPGGAPPRDWWHHVDAVLDAELDARAGQTAGWSSGTARTGKNDAGERGGNWSTFTPDDSHEARHSTVGARGVHLRRALERAGILSTLEAVDVSPKGYRGAHYAVWPPELVRLLVYEMCPRRVCVTCGQPSRRVNEALTLDSYRASTRPQTIKAVALADAAGLTDAHIAAVRAFGTSDAGKAPTLNNGAGRNTDEVRRLAAEAKAVLGGYFREFVQSTTAQRTSSWSDCGHDTWRPGLVLDPFVGSGTTLAVASGMGRDSIGIDLDMRNALLALDRVGIFLDIDWPAPDFTLATLPAGNRDRAHYRPWLHRTGNAGRRVRHVRGTDDEPPAPARSVAQPKPRPVVTVRAPLLAPQPSLFSDPEEEAVSA